MRYSDICFNTKREHHINGILNEGKSVNDFIQELMRKTGLQSFLYIGCLKDIEDYMSMAPHGKVDVIYINIPEPTDDFYEIIRMSVWIMNKNGYILVDGMFPYYEYLFNRNVQMFIKFRQFNQAYECGLQFNTLWDCSHGLGVISVGEDQYWCYNIDDASNMDYNQFEYFFDLCMNPVETHVFLNTIDCKSKQYKYSVITAIFDGYEVVREVQNPRDDVEYVLVTDDPTLISSTWKVKYVDSFFDGMSGYAKAFYVKYHPFEFIESDTFIWVDGSIQIKNDFTDIIMIPFINSNYEIFELTNMVTNNGKWEAGRWNDNGFHGFDKHQYDEIIKLFHNEEWLDEFQVQTTIYGGKNTRLLNMVNDRTWDIMRRNPGEDKDISILYMPQRGMILSKYIWNTHKVYFIGSGILFSEYFDYCYHKTNISQQAGWEEIGNDLYPEIWGSAANPVKPMKLK